jgi:hypothetical protein
MDWALTMNKELGLTAEMFGFGAGANPQGEFTYSSLVANDVGAISDAVPC